MKSWFLEFQIEAEKDLAKLDRQIRRRIIDKLDWLLKNFDTIVPLALTNELGEFYKLRVGDWRVIYKINWGNRVILVCYIESTELVEPFVVPIDRWVEMIHRGEVNDCKTIATTFLALNHLNLLSLKI